MAAFALWAVCLLSDQLRAAPPSFEVLGTEYSKSVLGRVRRRCLTCHAGKLEKIEEGGRSALDNSVLLYCSSMLTGHHDVTQLPVLVLGGGSGYSTRMVRAGGSDRGGRLGGTAGLTCRGRRIVGRGMLFVGQLRGRSDDVSGAADTPHLSPSAA